MVERPTSEGLFAAVRRRLWLALLCTLLVPAAAYGLSKMVDPEYTASATLLFREPPLQRDFPGLSFVIRDAEARRELLTNVELASLDVVAQRTAKRLGGGVTGAQVSQDVGISVTGDSDIATVEAKARSGELAARLANGFAREFIAFRRAADVRRIRPVQRRIERQIKLLKSVPAVAANLTRSERLGRLRTLRRRARSLDAVAAVQTGRAEVVEPAAVPGSPSSPKTRTNVAVGAALGLLLGLSLAFFVDRLDRRLRSPRDAERTLGLPVIGSIPRSRALSAKRDQVRLLPVAELEAFRSLWANLTHSNADEELRSVLITSPNPGDGRTTTAWHLAVAAAETGTRVLLLEADFRRPRLQHVLRLAGGRSLVQALTAQHDLSEEVQRVELPEETRWPANGGAPELAVDVIPAGPLPSDPSSLLASERMRQLLRVAQERYELVVIDAPPLLAVADAVPLLPEVSGALVVVRIGHTGRSDALRLAERLRNLRARPLGVVVNHSERAEADYLLYAEDPGARGAIPA
jgi:capsular exopolysaccharide synthesis family protein